MEATRHRPDGRGHPAPAGGSPVTVGPGTSSSSCPGAAPPRDTSAAEPARVSCRRRRAPPDADAAASGGDGEAPVQAKLRRMSPGTGSSSSLTSPRPGHPHFREVRTIRGVRYRWCHDCERCAGACARARALECVRCEFALTGRASSRKRRVQYKNYCHHRSSKDCRRNTAVHALEALSGIVGGAK